MDWSPFCLNTAHVILSTSQKSLEEVTPLRPQKHPFTWRQQVVGIIGFFTTGNHKAKSTKHNPGDESPCSIFYSWFRCYANPVHNLLPRPVANPALPPLTLSRPNQRMQLTASTRWTRSHTSVSITPQGDWAPLRTAFCCHQSTKFWWFTNVATKDSSWSALSTCTPYTIHFSEPIFLRYFWSLTWPLPSLPT